MDLLAAGLAALEGEEKRGRSSEGVIQLAADFKIHGWRIG